MAGDPFPAWCSLVEGDRARFPFVEKELMADTGLAQHAGGFADRGADGGGQVGVGADGHGPAAELYQGLGRHVLPIPT